jgi:hypothetical protein
VRLAETRSGQSWDRPVVLSGALTFDALGNAAEVWPSLGTVKTEYDVPATRDPLGARDRSSRSPGARVPGTALGSRACALPRERLGRFGEKAAGANN